MDAFANDELHSEENRLKSFLVMNAALSLDELFQEIYTQGLKILKKDSYQDDFTLVGFEVLS